MFRHCWVYYKRAIVLRFGGFFFPQKVCLSEGLIVRNSLFYTKGTFLLEISINKDNKNGVYFFFKQLTNIIQTTPLDNRTFGQSVFRTINMSPSRLGPFCCLLNFADLQKLWLQFFIILWFTDWWGVLSGKSVFYSYFVIFKFLLIFSFAKLNRIRKIPRIQ